MKVVCVHICNWFPLFRGLQKVLNAEMNAEPPKKRDRTNDNFARAMRGLMKRSDRISRQFGADMYVLLRRKYRHYEYNSSQDPSFPTPAPVLVSEYYAQHSTLSDPF